MSKKHSGAILLGMLVVIVIGLGAGLLLFYRSDNASESGKLTVTGTATDIIGSPLAGQTVQLTSPTNAQSTSTDVEGNFTFENVPPGSYTLQAQHTGAETESAEQDIEIASGNTTFEISVPVLTTEFDFMPAADESSVVTRPDGTQAIAGEIIVRWNDGISENQRQQIGEKYNLTLLADTPDILLSVFSTNQSVDDSISQLSTESSVMLAIPSYVLGENLVPYDPGYESSKNNWWLKQVNAEPAWELSLGRSVLVGVVDAGFDFKHQDLSGVFTQTKLNYTTEDINKSSDHGTHVSGMIAMQLNNGQGMVGIAPRVRIVPAKTHSMARVADAFRFFALCPSVKVISISMGNNWWSTNTWRKQQGLPDLTVAEKQKISGDIDTILEPSVKLLAQKNVLIVHSAGNDAGDASLNTLNFDEVVTVAATDANDALAVFSNKGASVDIAAPGTDVYSTITNSYDYKSGTSMSTPLVAGIAALVRSARPALTAAQVKSVLQDTAEPSAGLAAETFGRVDAWRALLKATKQMGVEGTVYDEATGDIVPKADVTDDHSIGVSADEAGIYQIAALPWTTVNLRAFANDKEDEQTVTPPEYDVVTSLVDFYLADTDEEDENLNDNENVNSNENENDNENLNVNEDEVVDEGDENTNEEDENNDDNTNDENTNSADDSNPSTGDHVLLDNGVVVSGAGCGVGGYPYPEAEGNCPQGFYFSRDTIACEQITCPAEAGRTYTLECKCPEGTNTIYACDIAGYVVACVDNSQ